MHVCARNYVASLVCARKIALAIIACVCGCGAFSSAQILPGAQALPDHIQGIVVNRVTREPIVRALVFSPDRRFAMLTDAQGRFQFQLSPQPSSNAGTEPPPDMPYALSARRPGFLQTPDATVNLTALRNRERYRHSAYSRGTHRRPGDAGLRRTLRADTSAALSPDGA